MKAKPYLLSKTPHGHSHYCELPPSEIDKATHIELHLPGPFPYRFIPVQTSGTLKHTNNWTWNGDVNKPTLKPSVKTYDGYETGDRICHSFITDGKVHFLTDSTHEYAGQTLDLLEVDE